MMWTCLKGSAIISKLPTLKVQSVLLYNNKPVTLFVALARQLVLLYYSHVYRGAIKID